MDFEEFVGAELPGLIRYSTMLAGDRELAQDVVQDVLVRAHARWRRISAADRPGLYLRKMITNEYLSWRRRRRTRIAGLAGVVALALVAGLVTISVARDRSAPPADPSPNEQWRATVAAGWVPDGMVLAELTSGESGEGFSYRSATATLDVTVDDVGPDRMPHLTGARRVEINGRTAYEMVQAQVATVVARLASGRWASVALADTTRTELDLRTGAEQVARTLREGVDIPVRIDIAPGYLPDGLRVVSVRADPQAPGRGRIVCSYSPESAIRVTIAFTLVNLLEGATRIADIQGRPAYLADGGRTVVVNIYHGGMLAVSAAENGILPVEELLKATEGVRWIGT